MAGNFASSTFSTGPQDSYRAVDVYSQTGTSPVTSYTERSTDSAGLSGIFGTSTGAASINALSLAKNSVAYGKQVLGASSNASALDRAMSGLGGLASGLKGASPGLQNYLTGGIGGAQNMYATVLGSVQRLKSGNLPDIRSVTNMINSVVGAGTINITDKNSIMGMTAGLISQATSMGIPKSFTALTTNLMGNPSLIAGIINKALPAVTKSSDIGTLKEFAMADPSAVKASNPNILGDFSFNYVSDDGTTQVAKVEAYKEVKSTFSTINPDWTSATRGVIGPLGETLPIKTFDVSTVCKASPDLKDVFKIGALSSDVPEDKLFLAAEVAPKATVREQLTASFPEATVAPVTPPTAPVVSSPDHWLEPTVEKYSAKYSIQGVTPAITKTTYPDGTYQIVEQFTVNWERNTTVTTFDAIGTITSQRKYKVQSDTKNAP